MDGVILDQTRRLNGAMNVLDLHIQSKRNVLKRKYRAGDKVISGPDTLEKGQVYAETVYLLHDGEIQGSWTYSIRENRHCPTHRNTLMHIVCNEWMCGKCYEDTLMSGPIEFAPKLVPLERVYDDMKHMWVERAKKGEYDEPVV